MYILPNQATDMQLLHKSSCMCFAYLAFSLYKRHYCTAYFYSNRDYLVPLNKLQRCHIIDHAKHLEHVILSHCSYSLLAGHGSEIEYDFAAMERHVLDAFLQGKPCISPSAVPVILYQNDAQKTSVFQIVREQITQVRIHETHHVCAITCFPNVRFL